VIGVPDEKWGEAIKAIVLLKENKPVDTDEIIDFVKQRLGSVKAPKSIDLVSDLPRSPAGKVLKTELRKPFWQGQGRSIN
jgi:acyl-CoA synthetase (AMP-forming)/AMP-acid ligase II